MGENLLNKLIDDVRKMKIPPPPYLLINLKYQAEGERLLSDWLLHDSIGRNGYKWTHILGHTMTNEQGQSRPLLGVLWPEGIQGSAKPIFLLG
jgi:hypothetical protein